jgi:ribosomal-protein-alanine N-acetyltransferase
MYGAKETKEGCEAHGAEAISLRSFRQSDLPAVLEIEQASFLAPWTGEVFFQELRNPHSRLLVADKAGGVVGYLCRWVVVDEGQILRVAVHPNYRRCGIGKALLQETLSELKQRGTFSISLEVRRGNSPAIVLYRKFGFRKVAIRPRYYENGEDALLMVCNLR